MYKQKKQGIMSVYTEDSLCMPDLREVHVNTTGLCAVYLWLNETLPQGHFKEHNFSQMKFHISQLCPHPSEPPKPNWYNVKIISAHFKDLELYTNLYFASFFFRSRRRHSCLDTLDQFIPLIIF